MEFRDLRDVLTFAAFRPEPDNPAYAWNKRFPNRRSVLLNVSRAKVSWAYLDKKGKIDDIGEADGEFLDISSMMADEWRDQTDDGWIGISLNTRFIITLEHNMSRKPGWEDTIRSNPKSVLGTKYDRTKRYALIHNPDTSSSLMLASDASIVQTIEDCLRNHNLRPGRISCGLFGLTASLLEQINSDASQKNGDLVFITWVDSSLLVMRQKASQWQEVRCRSGLPLKDFSAIQQMLKPFLDSAEANTRFFFLADEPENTFAQEFLPQMENYHVKNLTEPNQLWSVLKAH